MNDNHVRRTRSLDIHLITLSPRARRLRVRRIRASLILTIQSVRVKPRLRQDYPASAPYYTSARILAHRNLYG